MTDAVKEQLSACLDGELPRAEFELLLKRLERDPELRHSMGRYAFIGEALRASRPACASNQFAAKVAAAIGEEPAIEKRATAALQAPRWLRAAAGMAVAAGVAAVAILALQESGTHSIDGAPVATDRVAEVREPAATVANDTAASRQESYVVPTNTPAPSFIPAARLTNYAVAHSEYSSPLGRRTVLSGVLAADRPEEAADEESGAPQADPQLPQR